MDYDPFDPVQQAEALRDEAIGLRTTPEVGFFYSAWFISGTADGDFPVADRSWKDILLFKKRWYKSPEKSPERYITDALSGSFFRSPTRMDGGSLKIIRGDLCLDFVVEQYREEVLDVNLSNGVPTTLTTSKYHLRYRGWQIGEAKTGEVVCAPNNIHFLDTDTVFEEWANAFTNHYVKIR